MMKTKIALTFAVLFLLVNCKIQKTENFYNESKEVWEEGISMLTGTVTEIRAKEKNSQRFILTDKNQVEYELILTVEDLNATSSQYREIRIGEYLSFKGNLNQNKKMIVREILETQ